MPSIRRTEPHWQYAYGALACGAVYYDPGIKLENASTPHPGPLPDRGGEGERAKVKRRSQFRVASKNIAALYEAVEVVEV